MRAQIQKWGNSQGIRIPKKVLETSHLFIGDSIEISAKLGEVVIRKTDADPRGKYHLEDLVANMPKEVEPQEVPWGKAVGREEW